MPGFTFCPLLLLNTHTLATGAWSTQNRCQWSGGRERGARGRLTKALHTPPVWTQLKQLRTQPGQLNAQVWRPAAKHTNTATGLIYPGWKLQRKVCVCFIIMKQKIHKLFHQISLSLEFKWLSNDTLSKKKSFHFNVFNKSNLCNMVMFYNMHGCSHLN